MKTIINNGMTAKDLFNTKTSSKTIKDYEGVITPVYGYAICEDTDKATKEPVQLGYIKTENGDVIGFKSSVCIECLNDFDDFVRESETDVTKGDIKIMFTTGQAKSGREFYTFRIVD